METIESGQGLLKDYYDDSPLGKALKRKREKMVKKTKAPEKEPEEIEESE